MRKKNEFNDTSLKAENETNNEININSNLKDTQELIIKKIKKNTVDKITKLKDQKSNDKVDIKNIQNVITQRKINNNVNYKVQILAGHKIINSLYLSNLFNYKGDYEIESHMGWIKYTVGNHSL